MITIFASVQVLFLGGYELKEQLHDVSVRMQGNLSLCFVSADFSDGIEELDTRPALESTMIRDPPRHFFFTNHKLPSAPGWKTIVLDNLPYRRRITQSRWPKFLAWKLLEDQCDCIFYGDAYLMNPANETAWQSLAWSILHSPSGLMQEKQIGNNGKPVKGPVVELWRNARIGKVSWEAANYTVHWLRAQADYHRNGKTPVYKNAIFGYDPHNLRLRACMEDFWREYSLERGSWRDQSYWAYFLSKHKIRPLPFPFQPPMGVSGREGHNGHVYVQI